MLTGPPSQPCPRALARATFVVTPGLVSGRWSHNARIRRRRCIHGIHTPAHVSRSPDCVGIRHAIFNIIEMPDPQAYKRRGARCRRWHRRSQSSWNTLHRRSRFPRRISSFCSGFLRFVVCCLSVQSSWLVVRIRVGGRRTRRALPSPPREVCDPALTFPAFHDQELNPLALTQLVRFDLAHAKLRCCKVAALDGKWSVGKRFDLQSAHAACSDRWSVVHGRTPCAGAGRHLEGFIESPAVSCSRLWSWTLERSEDSLEQMCCRDV